LQQLLFVRWCLSGEVVKFTPAQQMAIEYDGAGGLCVIAGPGSGKTRVLVSRFEWLVKRKHCAPENILAVTFTRKAALEMRKRLSLLLTKEQAERAQISTIDAFCARLLRENAIEIGLDPDFEQLEPIDADIELRVWIEQALDEAWEQDPDGASRFGESFRKKEQGGGSAAFGQVLRLIQAARVCGELPESKTHGDRHAAERQWLAAVARSSLQHFAADKQSRGLMDFSDLTTRTVALLRDGKFPNGLRYKHILLDENQDTNPQQAMLMNLLRKRCDVPLFAVGDLNQSIYAFRNAAPQVFGAFRNEAQLSGKVVDLLDNFRSRPEILSAVRLVTAKAKGVADQPLRAGRTFAAKSAPSVEVLFSRKSGSEQEAQWVARRIVELQAELRLGKRGRAARWSDFAVLVRTNRLLTVFAEGLQWAGIPHVVNARHGFFAASEVCDLLAFLRTLDNPRDEMHLAATLRSPLAGIGDATLLALKADGADLYEALSSPPDGLTGPELEKLAQVHRLIDHYRARREALPLDVLVSEMISTTGFDAWLLAQQGGLQRSANAQKLAGLAGRAMEAVGSFRGAVRRLDAMAQASAGEGEAALPDDSTDAIKLMTIHAAKGLEFPVVVLGSIQNAGNPKMDPILYSHEQGVGVQWSDMEEEEGRGDPAYNILHAAETEVRKAEDGRLLYVAMTRAEDHLVLSAGWNMAVQKRGWTKPVSAALGLEPAKDAVGVRVVKKGAVSFRVMVADDAPERPEVNDGIRAVASPIYVERREMSLGQADSEAAVTSVALYATCPRRYYLSRYLGLESRVPMRGGVPGDDASEVSASELGTEVHQLLAIRQSPGRRLLRRKSWRIYLKSILWLSV
jgi:superfamily I DNA/RNA helicase